MVFYNQIKETSMTGNQQYLKADSLCNLKAEERGVVVKIKVKSVCWGIYFIFKGFKSNGFLFIFLSTEQPKGKSKEMHANTYFFSLSYYYWPGTHRLAVLNLCLLYFMHVNYLMGFVRNKECTALGLGWVRVN